MLFSSNVIVNIIVIDVYFYLKFAYVLLIHINENRCKQKI